MNNKINYDFLNVETNSFEKGKNLKTYYFSEGSRHFFLETNIMESFKNYIFFEKKNIGTCLPDSILIDFDFQRINKDSLKSISFFSDSVFIKNYNNDGDSIFEIFSEELIHYTNENMIELNNKVKLRNYKNNLLETNRLFWNIEKNKILSLDSIRIETNDKIIYGCGFYSDDNFENYKVYNISGTIQLDTD